MPSGSPRADPSLLFSAPRASKSAPRGVQERFIRLWKASFGLPSLFQGLKRPPGRLQEASRAHLAAMLAVFWSNFATHSKRCCHHVGHASSLKAPSLGPQKSKKNLGQILLDSDAARRLSRSELGSAAPRPLCGPAPCGVRNKNIPQGSRSRAARWVLRSKPLPLAGRTNRRKRQQHSGPVYNFFSLGAPEPSKTRGR